MKLSRNQNISKNQINSHQAMEELRKINKKQNTLIHNHFIHSICDMEIYTTYI